MDFEHGDRSHIDDDHRNHVHETKALATIRLDGAYVNNSVDGLLWEARLYWRFVSRSCFLFSPFEHLDQSGSLQYEDENEDLAWKRLGLRNQRVVHDPLAP